MFMFHHFLTGAGAPEVPEAVGSPAHALRAAQCWMLDPDRRPPRSLVGHDFARERPARPYSDTRIWAAFTHHGH
jgi:hypothetical protein